MPLKKRLAIASAVIVLGFACSAAAQTVTTGQTSPTATTTAPAAPADQALSDIITVPAWPKSGVALTADSQPVAASFGLGAVEGIDPKLLAGVTANGYARKVAVENQTVGQVLITSVAKDRKEEAISAEGLTAQFDASATSELFPQKSVQVQGSKAALVSALEKLAATGTEEEEKKAAAEEAPAKTISEGSSNDVASSYQVPTNIATEEDPTTTTTTTTEGCSVRVDIEGGAAHVQNKTQTFTDGALTEESACSDSGTSYTLNKSYLACGDEVALEEMKAWSRYTLYYVDNGGETHTVSECGKDDEEFYTITEDESQCSIFVDFAQSQAVPQSALVYTNRNNTVVQARGCEASTLTPAIAMTETTSGCTIRHDYAGSKSYQQSMWTYVRDGVTYIASACTDDGEEFPHETIYKAASGEYVCQPITDLQGRTVTLQYRKGITVAGTLQYITECTPDTASRTVIATTDGCTDMSKWTHDVSAAVSYGQERFYFEDGGARSYVTACQTSSATYAHSHEITGYQHHDDQLFAYPLTTVKVTAEAGTYTIANSAVLDGAPQMVYVLDGAVTANTSQSTYEGCNGWYLTTLSEKWKRPDDTVYLKAVGEGEPAGPRNVCQSQLIDQKTVVTGLTYTSHGGCTFCSSPSNSDDPPVCQGGTLTALSAVQRSEGKYQSTNTETGELVATAYDWIGTLSTTSPVTGTVCRCSSNYEWAGAYQTFTFEYFSKTCNGSTSWSCSGTWVTNPPTGW